MTPDEHTNQEFFIDVSDGHQLYVQDWGNAKAELPIVYLHGGPGNGCDDRDKLKFNPAEQRVIFHDQRGAGKSLPAGELKHNTTQALVEDITRIANQLELKKFILVGGSWGSTLALAYAIAHPERVKAILIDGVFTATKAESDWLEKGNWRTFYPEIWQAYSASVPATHRQNPTAYHFKQALGGNTEAAKRSAYEYLKMELALLKLDDIYQPPAYDKFEPAAAKIEIHYLANQCFMPEGHILKHAAKLTMPVYIIQGRFDMVCPPAAAYELDKALPNSQLVWTINGHMKQHEAKTVLSLLLGQLAGDD